MRSRRPCLLDFYSHHLNLRRAQESGSIRVYNDGAGVPVEVHKEHGVYVPELIFGHLLTSSNYDDKEKKVGSVLFSVCSLGFASLLINRALCIVVLARPRLLPLSLLIQSPPFDLHKR